MRCQILASLVICMACANCEVTVTLIIDSLVDRSDTTTSKQIVDKPTTFTRTQTNGPSRNTASMIPDTWAKKIESLERINSIRETNGNFDSCISWKRLGTSRLHELHESKFPFVSRIEFVRPKLSNCSAHVSGATVTDTPRAPHLQSLRLPPSSSRESRGRIDNEASYSLPTAKRESLALCIRHALVAHHLFSRHTTQWHAVRQVWPVHCVGPGPTDRRQRSKLQSSSVQRRFVDTCHAVWRRRR